MSEINEERGAEVVDGANDVPQAEGTSGKAQQSEPNDTNTAAALDPQVGAALNTLLQLLGDNDTIKSYQLLAKRIKNNARLAELEEQIKIAQKEAVNFDHYGKVEAARAARTKADELTAEFNTNPLVLAFRESLYEANDLLQYLTGLIEARVNEELTGGIRDDATKN